MTWEKLKPEQTRTLYETMWKDESIFAVKCLPTSNNESPSSYRFSDGKIVECCFEEVRKEHKKLTDIKRRLEAASKEEKDNYKKEYGEQKDTYDKKKATYNKAIKRLLIKQFGLKETQKVFKDKYDMAVSGSGSESFKITKLNSSSLCCLLFFYNVSDNNSLTLQFETNRGERTIEFTETIFEFKNNVFNAPSNIDVALIGTEKNNKDKSIILFLESKFAEYYYDAGGACNIGGKYVTDPLSEWLYADENLEELGLKKISRHDNKGKIYYRLENKYKDIFYIHGIKQMISHYCGIKKLLDGKYYKSEKQESVYEKIKKGATVILGEIVFHLPNGIANKEIERYDAKYKKLAKIIASHEKENPKFEILKELLSYSEFKTNSFTVDERVKAFYGMN